MQQGSNETGGLSRNETKPNWAEKRKRLTATLAISSAMAILTVSSPALSQVGDQHEAATVSTASQSRSDQFGTQDIVVTAQRREQRLQDVPIAVSVLSADTVSNRRIESPIDLNVTVPGVNSSAALGFFRPFIRGVGATATTAGVENTVATYVDGVYLTSSAATLLEFMDIERIEVLKGPQGTLFGRNATGGLISIVTKRPSQETKVNAEFTYANYNAYKVSGYVSSGIAPDLAFSVAAQYSDQGDGYGVNRFSGKDIYKLNHDLGVRGKLLFSPGDTEITLSGDYSDRSDSFFVYSPYRGYPVRLPVAPLKRWDADNNFEPNTTLESGGGSLRVEHDFGAVKLLSLSAYRKSKNTFASDNDTSPQFILQTTFLERDKSFSQELQLQSSAPGRVSWVVGLYYLDASGKLDPQRSFAGGFLTPLPTSTILTQTIADIKTKSYAAFGDVSVELTDRLTATAGLRYSREKRSKEGQQTFFRRDGSIVLGPVIDASTTFPKLTWRLVMDYKLAEHVMAYASFNRGFKAGGYNPGFLAAAPFRPETLDAYEVGLKSQLADNHVRLNIAGFYYDYSSLQVQTTVSGIQNITNSGTARAYGSEAELDVIPADYLTLSAAATYLDFKYRSYPNGTEVVANPTGGFTNIVGADLSGNRVPYAPKYTVSLTADFHFDTGSGRFSFVPSWFHNAGFVTEANNEIHQPAYDYFTISGRWEDPSEHYYVQAWVKNLANERVANQALALPTGANVVWQPPRTYGLTAGVRF